MKIKLLHALFIFMAIKATPLFANDKSVEIDRFIQGFHQIKEFNGTVLVAKNGHILFEKAYGYANFEWDIKNTIETKFRIASMTKQFTSMLIMQLVQQGKIVLDAPITNYLKNYRKDTGDKVTIHHLLTHTSGIPNYLGLVKFKEIAKNNPYNVDEFVHQLCSEDLEFTPGSKFRYSNSGYHILGDIIEKVTGKSYWQVLNEQILQPLGMKDSGYDSTIPLLKNRAYGYEKTFESYVNTDYLDMSNTYAAGAMYATAYDLMRWDQALYSEKLLKKQLIDKMYQATEQKNYGYGWMIDFLDEKTYGKKLTMVHHAGMIEGFNTNIARILEDKYLIVILNNTGGAPLKSITEGISKILYNQPYQAAKKRIYNVLYETIRDQGIGAGIAKYHDLVTQGRDFGERGLNYLGYELMKVDMIDEAIAFFKLNVNNSPNSANAYDSLAEAYLAQNNYKLALVNYKKALALDKNSDNARQAIERIKSRS